MVSSGMVTTATCCLVLLASVASGWVASEQPLLAHGLRAPPSQGSRLWSTPAEQPLLAHGLKTSTSQESKLWSAPAVAETLNEAIQHRESFDKSAMVRGWKTLETESCYELPANFPSDLQGTFFQNGPGKHKVGDEIIIHPLDGDGMVTAVTFDKGRAWFRNRFVQTPLYIKELEKQKVCGRGVFGTAKNNGAWYSNIFDVKIKNIANTHVLPWNNRLFALWEGGKPFELDPVTLETLGVGDSDLDGSIPAGQGYAAHYKIDPQTNTVCSFAIAPDISKPNVQHTVVVMEHNADLSLKYLEPHSLPGFGLAHDTAITETYFLFAGAPVKFDPLPFVLGTKGLAQSISWDDTIGKGRIHLVPRGSGDAISIDIPPAFCFHISNAFEEKDENGQVIVTIDVVMADSMKMTEDTDGYPTTPIYENFDFASMPHYQLVRYRLNPSTRKLVSTNLLSEGSGNVDFPVLHPEYVGKPYQYVYCGASASRTQTMPVQGIAKIDVRTGTTLQKWLPEEHQFLSEVAFCKKEGSVAEDDGYLVGYLMNGRDTKTEVVVFDAANVAQGPISQALLQDFIPHPLHGTFVPGFVPALTIEVKESFAGNNY
jgi:all-trans-8'-apo-beta-carotenal 15,15'-oxygenase